MIIFDAGWHADATGGTEISRATGLAATLAGAAFGAYHLIVR